MANNGWRFYVDVVFLCIYVPFFLITYSLYWWNRKAFILARRIPPLLMVSGISSMMQIFVLTLQDIFMIKGMYFPGWLVLWVSFQTITGGGVLLCVRAMNIVLAFKPHLKTPRNKWLTNPRRYWPFFIAMYALCLVPGGLLYHYQSDVWQNSSGDDVPHLWGKQCCWCPWFVFIPLMSPAMITSIIIKKYVRDVHDFYGLGREGRILVVMGRMSMIYAVLTIAGEYAGQGGLDRPWWDENVFPLQFLMFLVFGANHVNTAMVMYGFFRGDNLTKLMKKEQARARHNAEMSVTATSGSGLSELSIMHLDEGSMLGSRQQDEDEELQLYEGPNVMMSPVSKRVAGPSGGVTLLSLLRNPTSVELLLTHSKRALCPESVLFLQRTIALRAEAPGLFVPLEQALPQAPTASETRSASEAIDRLSPAAQRTALCGLVENLEAVRREYVAIGSLYELNLSSTLSSSYQKAWAEVKKALKELTNGNAPLSSAASELRAAPIAPLSGSSSDSATKYAPAAAKNADAHPSTVTVIHVRAEGATKELAIGEQPSDAPQREATPSVEGSSPSDADSAACAAIDALVAKFLNTFSLVEREALLLVQQNLLSAFLQSHDYIKFVRNQRRDKRDKARLGLSPKPDADQIGSPMATAQTGSSVPRLLTSNSDVSVSSDAPAEKKDRLSISTRDGTVNTNVAMSPPIRPTGVHSGWLTQVASSPSSKASKTSNSPFPPSPLPLRSSASIAPAPTTSHGGNSWPSNSPTLAARTNNSEIPATPSALELLQPSSSPAAPSEAPFALT